MHHPPLASVGFAPEHFYSAPSLPSSSLPSTTKKSHSSNSPSKPYTRTEEEEITADSASVPARLVVEVTTTTEARESTAPAREMGFVAEDIYGPRIEEEQSTQVYEYENTAENRSWAGALPVKQGLYDPELEKDACGVGFAA